MTHVDLGRFDNSSYDPGRGFVTRSVWFLVNGLVLKNPLNPSSRLRTMALRAFGARVGKGVVVKPGVSVKYPWNVEVGDRSWIGEDAWLDSLAPIRIGRDVCISQGVYCCTGNHDWADPAFGLQVRPIEIHDGAWVAARAVVLPGVSVGTHAVVTAGAVLGKDAAPHTVYAGNPAQATRERRVRES
jgi:putative colanic acid biosynthesis acetyltransferase WcaF